MDWGMSGETSLLEGKPGFALDFNFFVEDDTVVIDEADAREQQGCVRSKWSLEAIQNSKRAASRVP